MMQMLYDKFHISVKGDPNLQGGPENRAEQRKGNDSRQPKSRCSAVCSVWWHSGLGGRLELLDAHGRRRLVAGELQFARDPHPLACEIGTFLKRLGLRAALQGEGMAHTRNIQLDLLATRGERPGGRHQDLGGGEAGVLDGLGNPSRVEGPASPGKNLALALQQTYISTINAIQALQGLFGPLGSKPSYHAVNLDCGFLHLGCCREPRRERHRYQQHAARQRCPSHESSFL